MLTLIAEALWRGVELEPLELSEEELQRQLCYGQRRCRAVEPRRVRGSWPRGLRRPQRLRTSQVRPRRS